MWNDPADQADQPVPGGNGGPEQEANPPSRLRQMIGGISIFKLLLVLPVIAVIEARVFGFPFWSPWAFLFGPLTVLYCRPKPVPSEDPKHGTLGLWGDLDDVELIMDVEKAFNTEFTDMESEGMVTVGDIYRRVLEHLPKGADQGARFAKVMGFYRLRAALQPLWPDEKLRPGSSMARCKDMDVEEIYRPIKQAGLDTPGWARSEAGQKVANIVWATVALAIGLGLYFGLPWWSIVLAVIALFTAEIVILDRMTKRLPPQFDTFGALVTWVAIHNYGTFMKHGARVTEQDAWTTLLHIIEEHTGLEPAGVTPKTTIYA